jgi:hypothetical protein
MGCLARTVYGLTAVGQGGRGGRRVTRGQPHRTVGRNCVKCTGSIHSTYNSNYVYGDFYAPEFSPVAARRFLIFYLPESLIVLIF